MKQNSLCTSAFSWNTNDTLHWVRDQKNSFRQIPTWKGGESFNTINANKFRINVWQCCPRVMLHFCHEIPYRSKVIGNLNTWRQYNSLETFVTLPHVSLLLCVAAERTLLFPNVGSTVIHLRLLRYPWPPLQSWSYRTSVGHSHCTTRAAHCCCKCDDFCRAVEIAFKSCGNSVQEHCAVFPTWTVPSKERKTCKSHELLSYHMWWVMFQV
jgi:hypothetical protein